MPRGRKPRPVHRPTMPRITYKPPTPLIGPLTTYPTAIPPVAPPAIGPPTAPYYGTGPTGPSGTLQQPVTPPGVGRITGTSMVHPGSTAWMLSAGYKPDAFTKAFQQAQAWEYKGPTLLDIKKALALKKAKAYEYHGPEKDEFDLEALGGPWYQEMYQQPTGYGGGYYSPRYSYGYGGRGGGGTTGRAGYTPGVGRIYARKTQRGNINAQGLVNWRI